MTCLIVDDEPDARERLARMLREYPVLEVLGEAQDGLDAVQKIEQLRPSLLFLDIEMPGLSGFEVLRSISDGVPIPLVIFVTGYDQYALAAFESNALAYLLKPVEQDRLSIAVDRALKLHDPEGERRKIMKAATQVRREVRQIVCRKRDRMLLIPVEQILWFKVEGGLVRAKTINETYWVNHQLVELESILPDGMFFRARREVLVNLSAVKEIRPYFKSGFLLVMSDATEIALSERQAHPFRQRIPGL